MEIDMVLPASYAGYADDEYGISIPTVEDYKKLGKFAAETFTPYGDIQTGKDKNRPLSYYDPKIKNFGKNTGTGYSNEGMPSKKKK